MLFDDYKKKRFVENPKYWKNYEKRYKKFLKKEKKMSNTQTTNSTGIGFGGLLTVLFIGLKLTHYIDWSWWWVLSPTLIPLGIIVVLGIIYGALLAISK